MSHKEYALIKYNIAEDPQKKEKYAKIKKKLIKRHLEKMKAAVETTGEKTGEEQFVSRERNVEVIVPSEGDWPKNANIVPKKEERASAEYIKAALNEYEQCSKQEEAIKVYMEYLAELKGSIKGKIAELSQSTPDCSTTESPDPAEEDTGTSVISTNVLQKLQEALEKKACLDEQMLKACATFMPPP